MKAIKRCTVLTLALGGLVFTSAACDESAERQADRKVQSAVESSKAHRAKATTQEFNSALADLNTAASQQAASLSERIRANALLGEIEFEAGDRAVRELNPIDSEIARGVWEISQLGSQIAGLNSSSKSLAGNDPSAALKEIASKRGELATASSAAGQKAQELQGQIDKIKAQVNELIKQKDAAIAEADGAADKASKASLKEADALMDTVTESRRKAGNLGHDIDKVSATLLPLERDLATEEGKKKSADDAIATLEARKQILEGNWSTVQSQIQAQKTQIGKLGEELSSKATALDTLNKQAAAIRVRALDHFDKSAKHNSMASNDAKTLGGQLLTWSGSQSFGTAPEKKAWERLREVYNLNAFKLFEAEANNAAGNVHSRAAEQLMVQQNLAGNLAKQLADAGVPAPATLSSGIAADQKKEVDAANKAFTDAATKFESVYTVGTNPKEMKDVAQLSQMFSLYGDFLATGDQKKLKDAQKVFAENFKDRKDESFVRALPADLRG